MESFANLVKSSGTSAKVFELLAAPEEGWGGTEMDGSSSSGRGAVGAGCGPERRPWDPVRGPCRQYTAVNNTMSQEKEKSFFRQQTGGEVARTPPDETGGGEGEGVCPTARPGRANH